MTEDGIQTLRLELHVEDCGQVHLLEHDLGETPNTGQEVAYVEVRSGIADIWISTQWGRIPFTVTVADRDPGADLDGYDDVVEIGYSSASGRVVMAGWALDWSDDDARHLPPLPAGPGDYRLRYHVRGIDAERCAVDDHYLQIWPSPPSAPVVRKATSRAYEYFKDPKAYVDAGEEARRRSDL
ncbi:hypothetical protein [Herbidospora yilanensis]|uniref:hypothetical protein n=1 Tax=Herbidospora yilanensis TaxID=354426 RepID=UPI0007840720|nr:hypothetical protein [Herbidospora yilanensis]